MNDCEKQGVNHSENRHHWRETKDRDLTGRIPAIVKELEKAVVDVARLIEEGQRQAELEHRQWEAQQAIWEREQAKRRAAEALKESKEELLQIIARWAEARNLDQFFADAERRIPESVSLHRSQASR